MRVTVYFLIIQTVWALPLQQNRSETAEYEGLQYSVSQAQHNADYQDLQTGVQYLDMSSSRTKHKRSEDFDQETPEETGAVEEGEDRGPSNAGQLAELDYRDLLRKQSRFAHLNLGANLGPVGKLGLSAGLGPGAMTGLGLGAQLGQLGGGAALGLTSSGLYLVAAAGQSDHYLDLAEYYKHNNNNYKNRHLLRNSPPPPTPPPAVCCLLYGRGQPAWYSDFPIGLRA